MGARVIYQQRGASEEGKCSHGFQAGISTGSARLIRSGVQYSLISSGLFVSRLTETPLPRFTSSQDDAIHTAPQTAIVMAVPKATQARLWSRLLVVT
ncbi:hypothetical protein [Streptomyces muensis]|uniref:Uncharacterized protein n=1 Tax=Streptomyces muensis TaxID=1077944 RepID=A0A9X1Q438_STRM4|nr:hypothetical protein [Streptomyces muensis]MCF1598757.1 hypothetical protein [Streptomyces muensis]